MATLKYSRQREAIKEFLAGTKEHPTADTVYMHVREEFPRISLIKITTPDGGDRFDAVTSPHYHVICTSCGRVIDLKMDPLDSIDKLAEKCFDGCIDHHTALFYGTCGDCLKKNTK